MASTDIQEIYIAYYGRPADPGGAAYWEERLEDEAGVATIMEEFGNSAEYTERFTGLSNTELVNAIYQRLFNRDADTGGLAFYVGKLDSKELSLQSIALDILAGAQNEDIDKISHKVWWAEQFTDILANNDPSVYSGEAGIAAGTALINTAGSAWTIHWEELEASLSEDGFGDGVPIEPPLLALQFISRLTLSEESFSIDTWEDIPYDQYIPMYLLGEETNKINGIFHQNPSGNSSNEGDSDRYTFVELDPGNYSIGIEGGNSTYFNIIFKSTRTGERAEVDRTFYAENGDSLDFSLTESLDMRLLVKGDADGSAYEITITESDTPFREYEIELESEPTGNPEAYEAFFDLLFY